MLLKQRGKCHIIRERSNTQRFPLAALQISLGTNPFFTPALEPPVPTSPSVKSHFCSSLWWCYILFYCPI